MNNAYKQTIEDFRIELCNTPWWKFKRVAYLQQQIEYYESLLYKNNKDGK